MKYALGFFMLIASELSVAQVFEVATINRSSTATDSTEEYSYSFPLVKSTQRPQVAKIMNNTIRGDNSNPADPFADFGGEDEYFFNVFGSNERVLSLVLTGFHTGCGSHVTRKVFNFDSRTGRLIDLNQMFGADGQVKLTKALLKAWKNVIKANLSDEVQTDDYKNCLAEAEKSTDIYFNRMVINDNGISVWAGACLDGSQHERDPTIGPHEFSLGQLLPMLTPYGYSLFANALPVGPVKTLLRGTVDNKYPISMTILPGGAGTVTGMIVYDRIGEPLNMNGTMEGNQFVLHEVDASNVALSNIEVTWDGSKLVGSFTNLKTKKQMAFVVAPVLK